MCASSARHAPEWDYEIADRVASVGEWDLLFDALERAECELGVDGRLRLLGLLGRLAAAGADLRNLDFLRAHLVPIVATGPEKAAEVADVIGRWTVQAPSGATADWQPPDAISVVLRADRRSWGWLTFGVVVLIVVLLAWAMGWFHLLSPNEPGAAAARPEIALPIDVGGDWQSRLQDIAIRLVFALPVVFFGLLLAGWRSAAGDRLVRRAGHADWSELFTLAAERVRWFAASDARRLFEALTQHLYTLTDRIDVPASVQATLRAGMSPDVRYQTTEERANYVVLVDRRGAGDHVELLLQSLVTALAAAKIRFSLYEFRGRPAFCTSRSADPGARVAQPFTILAKRHAGERLLLISDGDGLFEAPGWRALRNRQRVFIRPGTPVAEMSRLRDFGHAVLLTPTPRPAWGHREQLLRDLGFLVVPADTEGINLIGQHIARGGEELPGNAAVVATDDPFISGLSRHALRYASNIPPPPEEIANLVTDLRIWVARTVPDDALRPGRGFLVLCGVAAFPTIAPGLTLQIAQLLSRSWGEEEAPIDSGILAPLARLPWLHDGRMPDWLRIALLNSLGDEDFTKIRKLQLAVLGEAQPASGPIDAAGLGRIAAAFEVAIGKPADQADEAAVNEAAARIGQGLPGEEVERIFLAVLHGERLDPVRDVIAPEAPEVIRERLARAERLRRAAWLAATAAAAGAVALVEPVLAAWIAAGWYSFTTFSAALSPSLKIAGIDAMPWFGVAATIWGALCLMCWLIPALWENVEPKARRRFLNRLRYGAMLPVALAAVYVSADPVGGRMPLLFALSAVIFLWFAPARRTPGMRSAEETLPRRLAGDDWIATSLGSVVVAVLALGPMFLLALPAFADPSTGFTLQLAAVLVVAATWGFGSRYVRREMLGQIEGRPTANEQWLDFVAPALSLLLIAASSPTLLPSVWLVSFGLIGLSLAFLTLRLKPNRSSLTRYVALWSLLLAVEAYFVAFSPMFILLSGELYALAFFVFSTLFGVIAFTERLSPMQRVIRTIGVSAYAVVLLIILSNVVTFIYQPETHLFLRIFVVLFVPAAAIFWPSLRFILMAESSTNRFTGFEEARFAQRLRATFRAALASAWWFVPALWLISLSYRVLGLDIDVMALAVPLAVVAGWRCGFAATIPVLLVGALPFIAQADLFEEPLVVSPGGFWPVLVLPLLARIIGDEGLRGRILARRRASLWDGGLFVVCLATAVPNLALGPTYALSIDPSWLAAAVGFIVGASRMRWHEPAIVFVAGAAMIANLGLNGWGFGTWALSAASFFGGRVWRSFVLPETAGVRGIGAAGCTILMIWGAGMAFYVPELTLVLSNSAVGLEPRQTPLLLLALAGGIAFRKLLILALATWSMVILMWASAVKATLAQQPLDVLSIASDNSSTLVCLAAFSLFGYLLGRHGEAAYARALGFVAQAPPRSAERGTEENRSGTDRGHVEKPVAA
jgi:hypothetical protein